MSPETPPGYGTRLALLVGAMLLAAGVAVVTLLRVDPALQVRVFGVAGHDAVARSAAPDIRAEGGLAQGLLPADLGYAMRLRPAGGHPWDGVIPQWTTLGLDAAA